ncbi:MULTISPECIES: NACHT domain-containing protein [Nitrosomonas]|uniref:NACHT domain-containing protein n=1 Tax=Nitrosomonas communis TaxID=44574 RepID=A0A0F7KEW4_9PROT|nr:MULTISPECIES: NACHT domain-containing protein [Nitrosomonas]AKH37718.1 hypothetical protein AAW31_07730 [Nitrosomonas communis]TYP87289.1 NACHT domain-containing protein [Nitrosomonas communis]UVS63033.1 NACHT domain-containing protein [Nitrosomonas sp. PLL12]
MNIPKLEDIDIPEPVIELVNTLLEPLAKKIKKNGRLIKEHVKYEFSIGALSQYINNSYNRHLYFNSLVFRNEQKLVDNYYLPLTLLKQENSESELNDNRESYLIDKFPYDLILKYKKILIVDHGGMGKSTILKRILLSCIREKQAIPIFIELRKLSRKKNILDFIVESTKTINDEVPKIFIRDLISTGRFLFLLDGFDEIDKDEQAGIISSINKFITTAPNNWYVMTSRNEDALFAFPYFQRFAIKPLYKDEAYKLLRLYDQDNKETNANILISKLNNTENRNVFDFLTNPLLTSLLYISFKFSNIIPNRIHIFYRQVFEALFEKQDLLKEGFQRKKSCNLDIDQFDELIRHFSLITYGKQKVEYLKTELLEYIDKAKILTANSSVPSSHIAHDLTHGVPLMTEEGNYIRWVHRSMQEYFAAVCICRDSKEKQHQHFLTMYTNEKHRNLTMLCADIDPLQFRKTVVKDLATNLLTEFNESYIKLTNIPKELINERKKLTAGKFFVICKSKFFHDGDDPVHERKFLAVNRASDFLTSVHETTSTIIRLAFIDDNIFLGLYIRRPYILLNDMEFRTLIPFAKEMENYEYYIYQGESQISKLNLPQEEFIIINDDPNSPVNQKDNFGIINNLLFNLNFPYEWYIDHEHAKKTLKLIEDEAAESNSLELFG